MNAAKGRYANGAPSEPLFTPADRLQALHELAKKAREHREDLPLAVDLALGRVENIEREQWALVVRDSSDATTVRVMRREAFLRSLEEDATAFLQAGQHAKHRAVRDIIARVNRNPTEIPELVMFREGGVELWFARETT